MTTADHIQADRSVFAYWGFWAVLSGVVSVVMVFAFIGGPSLEPAPSVGSQIGEIAGEIKRSAWRSFFGLAPETPKVVEPSLWDRIGFIAPLIGGLAILLSVISLVRRENWRLAAYGTGLGVGAITFHFFWWVALLICGTLLLVAIIENIGDIFSF